MKRYELNKRGKYLNGSNSRKLHKTKSCGNLDFLFPQDVTPIIHRIYIDIIYKQSPIFLQLHYW